MSPGPKINSVLFLLSLVLSAEEPYVRDVHLKKENGQPGPVTATIEGKPKTIASRATQAWAAMGGENALFLTPPSKNETGSPGYHLRLYDAHAGRSRSLGRVPFATAELQELQRADGTWIFLLKGVEAPSNQPLIFVADTHSLHARLAGVTESRLEGDALSLVTRDGQRKAIPVRDLLGLDMLNIYTAPASAGAPPVNVNFLPDGSAIVLEADGRPRHGHWLTDGDSMFVTFPQGAPISWPRQSLSKVAGVPAGTRIVVRLLQPLSSFTADEGNTLEAVTISPIGIDGKLLIPQGSKVTGTISKSSAVGWAVARETAKLTVDFKTLSLPNGKNHEIHSRIAQVENAREKVNAGTIEGVRSTASPGHRAKSKLASVSAVDPLAYIFTSASSTAVLGYTEPEILYPAGTEWQVELTAPLLTQESFPSAIKPLVSSPAERDSLAALVRDLPFRTSTKGSNKPSDMTSLLFLGPPEGLQRAFRAAGWVSAEQLTAATTFQTLKSIAGNEGFSEAPMSTLLLDERPPIYALAKTTNTFAARHHLRVFDLATQYQGLPVLTSSATQDIGIAFSPKQKTFIHVIDQYIDNERSKIVNDLVFTGCVEGVELVARPWVPRDAYNATGDRLQTDGAIAVLRLNECLNPRTTPTEQPRRARRFQRGVRNTMLTLRNDVWRGNLLYQGIEGIKFAHGYLSRDKEMEEDRGAWQKADLSGAEYEGFGDIPEQRHPSTGLVTRPPRQAPSTGPSIAGTPSSDRWAAPLYEIAVNGGWLRRPNPQLDASGIVLTPLDPALPSYETGLAGQIDSGWTWGLSVTTNNWRWISSEFGYHSQHAKYSLTSFRFDSSANLEDAVLETERVGLITRQFEYSVLVHGRPRESRWRPYVAVGPALQLLHLSDSPVKRPAGPFRFGLQNIGLLKAAFDFGRTPPLDGGGAFQVGLQWGAGVKFRVHPRLTIRADFRETWSKNPNIIGDSYTDEELDEADLNYESEVFRVPPTSKFRLQRFTLGFAFTF